MQSRFQWSFTMWTICPSNKTMACPTAFQWTSHPEGSPCSVPGPALVQKRPANRQFKNDIQSSKRCLTSHSDSRTRRHLLYRQKPRQPSHCQNQAGTASVFWKQFEPIWFKTIRNILMCSTCWHTCIHGKPYTHFFKTLRHVLGLGPMKFLHEPQLHRAPNARKKSKFKDAQRFITSSSIQPPSPGVVRVVHSGAYV